MNAVRVMVVEDERIVALHLKQQLTKLGYNVVDVAASGETALERLPIARPDALLMDIHLDGALDGIDTVARIPESMDVPVIYLTAYSEEATLERARATKPYGFLVKPYSERELHATLQMALERHRVALALRASEERFRSIFGAVTDGIFLVDAISGKFVEANEAGCAMLGYTAQELTALDISAVSSGVPPYTQVEAATWIERAATTGKPQRFAWHARTKDGRILVTEVSLRFTSIGGRSVVLSVVRDVTHMRAIEAQLAHAQKMESIGQLTGGLAHDFNNLLAVIHGNLELAGRRAEGDPEQQEMLSDALRATQRGATLTHQMLAYSRRQPLLPQVVQIDRLVADFVTLLRRTLGETIEIARTLSKDLWPTEIDPNQLENALLNLAVNARDAMPDGGTLTIAAENCVVDDAHAQQNVGLAPGRYVRLSVSDTGTGMPAEIVDRALEPFFTTKPVGQGSGLGLSMVYGFVKQSGGHLKINSKPGAGTTVRLYLPRATGAEDGAPHAPSADVVRSRGNETILVIEDDDMVRKLIVRTLGDHGYRVIQAANGPDALKILRDGGLVDLLLADVVLPKGMNGPAIAREAQALRPGLKVLFMSGFAGDILEGSGLAAGDLQLLSKPFTNAQLGRKLREILDGESE